MFFHESPIGNGRGLLYVPKWIFILKNFDSAQSWNRKAFSKGETSARISRFIDAQQTTHRYQSSRVVRLKI